MIDYYEHYVMFQSLEFITTHKQATYFVNRECEELQNILDPEDVVPITQVQFGWLSDGCFEKLERYANDRFSIVLDSSPDTLDEIFR